MVGEAFAGQGSQAEPYQLIQVSASLESEKTRKRELDSLDTAMAATGLDTGTVVTLGEEATIQLEHGQVRVIPAWKWLLGTK